MRREIYTGQWMLCELDQEFPTWLTIWPRDKMDKLFHAQTIRTGNATFDKRFNLSSDNEQGSTSYPEQQPDRADPESDGQIFWEIFHQSEPGREAVYCSPQRAGIFDIGKGNRKSRAAPSALCPGNEVVYRHGGCIPHLQSLRYNLYPDRRFCFMKINTL